MRDKRFQILAHDVRGEQRNDRARRERAEIRSSESIRVPCCDEISIRELAKV